MNKLTEAQLAKADAIEITRTAINLKYRLNARRERNAVIPDLADRIDAAIAGGPRLKLEPGKLFEAALEGDDAENDKDSPDS